ncbi:MAG: DUF2461 domain-containing protein [Ignavibacteria bacterium]|jgi:uncharacterized protein (TIGR02453 family)
MIQGSTLDFLKGLKRHNNREWFNKNKELYDDAKKDFEGFISELIHRVSEFDRAVEGLQIKDCVFRIYRDVRFSKDKTPYKYHFGAVVGEGGRRSELASYYFHIEPGGNSLLAGGKWMPSNEHLLAIRNGIFANLKEFNKIINDKDFKKYFRTLSDEKLSSAPRGFPKDHPDIELIKFKSYSVYTPMKDEQVLSKSIADYSVKVFKAVVPFNTFLNDCMRK